MSLPIPTISLHSTDPDRLIEQYSEAALLMEQAAAKLDELPHRRDYAAEDDWREADMRFAFLRSALNASARVLRETCEGIADQRDARRSNKA